MKKIENEEDFMKKLVFLFAVCLMTTSSFASTFKCNAPKSNPNAFLVDSYAIVDVNSESLRFKQYDKDSNVLMRDYQYKFEKIAGGRSKVTGMMKFVFEMEIEGYGDSISTLYADQSLLSENSGSIMFTGYAYSWDRNFCKKIN